jgi:hypothetical protein
MTPSKFSLPPSNLLNAKPGFFIARVVGESMKRRNQNLDSRRWGIFVGDNQPIPQKLSLDPAVSRL